MNILYVSSLLEESGSGGAHVSNMNYEVLKSLHLVGEIEKYDCSMKFKSKLFNKGNILINSIFGFTSNVSVFKLQKFLNSDLLNLCELIWLDGSLYGDLAKSIKEKYPRKKIITFFHNIESDFYNDVFGSRGRLYKPLISSVNRSENLAVQYSDVIITLTNSDSSRLLSKFQRSADFILPVFFIDKANVKSRSTQSKFDEYLLFIGSDFPPNIEALNFLCEEVMPSLNMKLLIVGKGLDKYKEKYTSINVDVIGFVEDLESIYLGAKCVLAPIFSGAGMKVKIAEALMYGKHVIATDFALVGYDVSNNLKNCFVSANTSQDFIDAANGEYAKFNKESRAYFEKKLSFDVNRHEISKLIKSVCK